jgi:predicted membrane protein
MLHGEYTMRRLIILAGALLLLIIGGGLTSNLIATGGIPLPILTSTINPDASRAMLVPWKAEQFFLLIGFIIFNLVGIAATIAFIVYLLDRNMRSKKANAKETNVTTVRE